MAEAKELPDVLDSVAMAELIGETAGLTPDQLPGLALILGSIVEMARIKERVRVTEALEKKLLGLEYTALVDLEHEASVRAFVRELFAEVQGG